MLSLRNSALALLVIIAAIAIHSTAFAADPGLPLPSDGVMNDQKPGSVLIFNYYSSGATSANSQNTRISITNTNPSEFAFVRLYLASDSLGPGAILRAFLCLVPNQTASFLASDADAGISGYIIAVAVHPQLECPVGFNYLTGNADIKVSSGHRASLSAQTIAALYSGVMPGCQSGIGSATLAFNGSNNGYDRLPRTLAVDKIASPQDGNSGFIIINRFGGSLSRFTDRIGLLVGTIYDESGNSFSFTQDLPVRQYRSTLSGLYAQLDAALPSGRKGWMKISATQTNDFALFGAFINLNPNSASNRTAFSGGQNLRALTYTSGTTLTIPMVPPRCD